MQSLYLISPEFAQFRFFHFHSLAIDCEGSVFEYLFGMAGFESVDLLADLTS
jgi:hypothetical protein